MSEDSDERRHLPNILIAGTPGTGKSTLCQELSKVLPPVFEFMNAGHIAKENNLCDGYDESLQCDIIDEDKLLDYLEDKFCQITGGLVLEYHGGDLFPPEWFDAVFVLRATNTILFDRLKARNYSENKIKNNVECEIFQTILDEAKAVFDEDMLYELHNEKPSDLKANIEFILKFVDDYQKKAR